ncbi:MAG: hypothetical protein N2645_07270 [Clostridia bacterium]|nr:hypothetical protein [Clostridia bacterium]
MKENLSKIRVKANGCAVGKIGCQVVLSIYIWKNRGQAYDRK